MGEVEARVLAVVLSLVVTCGCADPDRTLIDCEYLVGDGWNPELGPEEYEMEVRVNYARESGTECRGVWWDRTDALTSDDELTCSARLHARNMLEMDFFDHISPSGATPADRATVAGYEGRTLSENISCGRTDGEATARALVESTSGHCENIMAPEAVVVGLGSWSGEPTSSNGWTHCWVMVFGSPD